jgi:hypothetical protein
MSKSRTASNAMMSDKRASQSTDLSICGRRFTAGIGCKFSSARSIRSFVLILILSPFLAATTPAPARERPGTPAKESNINVLWVEPADLTSRNLLYGPSGKEHQPQGPMTFLDEDLNGTNPKFDVRDANGGKWRVKLGPEARPEVVASRLLWAVGYFSDQDYFLPELKIENLPAHLHRGRHLVGTNGTVHAVRLERHIAGEKKLGEWHWKENPFTGSRELNGLRVMMALINNWDLKDQNNSIYSESANSSEKHYVVSDLGATFGTTGFSWTEAKSKGNLNSYRHSRFIKKISSDHVDFNVPTRPVWIRVVSLPAFIRRLGMRSIGKRIPRADAKWMGSLLAKLSPEQIRDAFKAAGYSSDEVEAFAQVLERRISELNNL